MNVSTGEMKYPVGIQSFPEIREGGYLYVDKTALLYELTKGKYYFLSRPRRFGKSLMISTLETYYRGRRELFKGLALDSLTEDWEVHPVLHLDLSNGQYRSPEDLVQVLDYFLKIWEREYGVAQEDIAGLPPNLRFNHVIRSAWRMTGKKVVILVDEYDKPVLNAIANETVAEGYRSLLKAFYSNLKSLDEYIEIGVLTGVARFSKVSIFSDLNNLRDISFEERFAGICGVTTEELDKYFAQGMIDLAIKQGLTREEVGLQLRMKYDGYHFAKVSPDIYNPFSLMNVFAKLDMGTYWVDYGTPEFLVSMIESGNWLLADLAPVEIDADYLQSAGLLTSDPVPALYQTGYLTIKEYDSEFRSFILDYPNEEVRHGLSSSLVPYFIEKSQQRGRFTVQKFVRYITSGDIDGFMQQMESMIAGVPYSERGSSEAHFQNACYILFTLMGQFVKVEDHTSDGRIDLTVEASRYVYLFEFKVNSSAEEAMAQIQRKKYWLKYVGCGKEICLIAAAFDSATRRLTGYLVDSIKD